MRAMFSRVFSALLLCVMAFNATAAAYDPDPAWWSGKSPLTNYDGAGTSLLYHDYFTITHTQKYKYTSSQIKGSGKPGVYYRFGGPEYDYLIKGCSFSKVSSSYLVTAQKGDLLKRSVMQRYVGFVAYCEDRQGKYTKTYVIPADDIATSKYTMRDRSVYKCTEDNVDLKYKMQTYTITQNNGKYVSEAKNIREKSPTKRSETKLCSDRSWLEIMDYLVKRNYRDPNAAAKRPTDCRAASQDCTISCKQTSGGYSAVYTDCYNRCMTGSGC